MVISIEINVSNTIHRHPLILLYPFVARIIANKRHQDGTSRGGRREKGGNQMLPIAVLRLMADTLMNIRSPNKKLGPLLFPCD